MKTKNWKETGFTLISENGKEYLKCEKCGHEIDKQKAINLIPEDIAEEVKMKIAINYHKKKKGEN